jgi:hypothetical protein
MTINDEQFDWLRKSHEQLQADVTMIREDVAVLKFKAGVWGLIAGAIPVAILIILLVARGAF